MKLEQCVSLAGLWYRGRLEPGWRGRSPEASQAIFAEVGLEGDFWRMT